MKDNSARNILFSLLVILSLSSSLYLNSQSKLLQAQGYTTTPELFEEDFENLLPDVKIIENIMSQIRKMNNI